MYHKYGISTALTRRVSGPALALVVSLALLIILLYTLSKLHLLLPFLESRPFTITTFVLAAVAIIFGSIQFADSRRHSKKMEDIAGSMSTRYIGVFPKNLEDILEVVDLADRELLVMADFVDYGHYSNPRGYEKFAERIKEARDRGVEVKLLVYDRIQATKALEEQFPEGKWATEKESPEHRHFVSVYPGIVPPDSHEEFLHLLRRKGRELDGQLLDKKVEIRVLPDQQQLFFWLEDDEDAVFSFENIGEGDPLCFRTRDAKIIEIFRCIFKRNWASSQDYLSTLKAGKEIRPQRTTGRTPDIGDLPAHTVRSA